MKVHHSGANIAGDAGKKFGQSIQSEALISVNLQVGLSSTASHSGQFATVCAFILTLIIHSV